MFKIGEFSKLTQVSVRMLRYYDEMNLLKPAETDPITGYRQYSVEQISVLNKIVYLRDSGFNVSEIVSILRYGDNEHIIEALKRKCTEIRCNIETEQEKLRKIELATKELMQGDAEMHDQITIKSIPSCHVLSLRKVIANYYVEGELWKELSEFVHGQKIAVSNETFSIYHDEDFRDEHVDVELCAIVSKDGQDTGNFRFYHTEPVAMMASTMVYGDFSNISAVYLSFAKWLQKNSLYKMMSPTRQIVHRGPWNEENPQHYLTEIQIPIEKIS